MPNNFWCPPCGQMWETEVGSHEQSKCPLQKEMNEYFNVNFDKAFEIKHLLTWFNSFKTLKEYLKNDEDISKIKRDGFYHGDRNVFEAEWKDAFEELRRREKNKSLPFEQRFEADIRQDFIEIENEVKAKLSVSDLDSWTFSEEIPSRNSSSTISTGTKNKLEIQIKGLEIKIEEQNVKFNDQLTKIQVLLEKLAYSKTCDCSNNTNGNTNGFTAQVVQPNK